MKVQLAALGQFQLCRDASAMAGFWASHPRQWRADIFKYFHRFCESAESLSCGGQRKIAVEGTLTCPKCGLIDRAASMRRPFVEKFQRILETRDFLNHAYALLDKDRGIEHPVVHLNLQVERILEFRNAHGPKSAVAHHRYVIANYSVQYLEGTGR